jgi:hypothetical protein
MRPVSQRDVGGSLGGMKFLLFSWEDFGLAYKKKVFEKKIKLDIYLPLFQIYCGIWIKSHSSFLQSEGRSPGIGLLFQLGPQRPVKCAETYILNPLGCLFNR